MLRTYHFLFCHKSFYLKHRSLSRQHFFIFYFYFYFYFLIILIMVYNLLLKHPRSSLLPSTKPWTQGISLSIISHSLLHFFFIRTSPLLNPLKRKSTSSSSDAGDQQKYPPLSPTEFAVHPPGDIPKGEYETGRVICEVCRKGVSFRDEDSGGFTLKHWDAHRLSWYVYSLTFHPKIPLHSSYTVAPLSHNPARRLSCTSPNPARILSYT